MNPLLPDGSVSRAYLCVRDAPIRNGVLAHVRATLQSLVETMSDKEPEQMAREAIGDDIATEKLIEMFVRMGQQKRIRLGQTPAGRAVFASCKAWRGDASS
jgi:hypothetical protein